MAGIDLNYTTLDGCESVTGWTAVSYNGGGTASQLEVSDAYDAREGTNCLEWGASINTVGHCGYRSPTWTAFDLTQFEFGCWFLLPKASNDEDQILNDGDDALKLRLYSQVTPSEEWGDYWQGGNDTLDGGWIYLRCSGPPVSASSASFDNTSIIAAAILVQNVGANNGDQKNGDAYYAHDWFKRYNKITVSGYKTGTDPWTLDDIYTSGASKPFWGFPERTDIFYRFFSGLEFGDGVVSGSFVDENKYVYFDQSSVDVDYDTVINDKHVLTLGSKVVGNQRTYAINGVQWVSRTGRPDFTCTSGGTLGLYSCRIEGWNNVELGSNGQNNEIEIIKTDFFDNTLLRLRSTGLDMTNVRMHVPTDDELVIDSYDFGNNNIPLSGSGRFAQTFTASAAKLSRSVFYLLNNSFSFIEVDDQGGNYRNVWGDGTYIYAACGGDGLRSYSVNPTGGLTFIDVDDQGTDFYRDVWGDGTYIYTVGNDGLRSYSVNPTGGLTFIDLDYQGSGNYQGVWGDGNFVYAACDDGLKSHSVNPTGGLTFIDVDRQGLEIYYGVWGDGTYIYAACDGDGLRSYSVNPTGGLTFIDLDYHGGNYYDVWGDGTYIYTACFGSGLVSYSVNPTGGLIFLDENDQGDFYRGVWGDGSFVYAACDTGGLRSHSVDGSGNLNFLNEDDQGGSYLGVWGDGNFVYAACGGDGLRSYYPEGGNFNVYSKLYATSGSPASAATPIGDPLATSDPISTIGKASYNPYSFTFDGYQMSDSIVYAISLEGVDSLRFQIDKTSPSHPGTAYEYKSMSWQSRTYDMRFLVYGETLITNVSAGIVYTTPENMLDVAVFNVGNGLEIRSNTKIVRYFAGDTVSDLVIREGRTAVLVDSSFDEDKLKYID